MPTLHDHLKKIRSGLPRLAGLLRLDAGAALDSWCQVVDTRLLTRFDPGFPLVAAICGGGSSGKSTLFNSLLGGRYAPTGGRAGMNRRVLFSVPEPFESHSGFIAALLEPFAVEPRRLERPEDLLQPGEPLYRVHPREPHNLILLDTPDFDTGYGGGYVNRRSAQSALEASDILIYIFTNANYNNRDNTDFIARMLTGIGRRKCVLVYRVYPSFTSAEVTDHAMTVARNIYGADAERYVLGIFRADEDNRIAAGETLIEINPVEPGGPSFSGLLGAIDVQRLRFDLHASMVADALEEAARLLERARGSRADLKGYRDALQAAQALCLQEALQFFPADRVMRRFAKIWAASDPPAVKLMRRTGTVVEFPLKVVLGAAGWARGRLGAAPPPAHPRAAAAGRLEENLITAATRLHHLALSPQIALAAAGPAPGADAAAAQAPAAPLAAAAHPVASEAQEALRRRDIGSILQGVLSQQEAIGRIGEAMDGDLRVLADHFRSRMDLWSKIGQTFWAFLNVLPATLAVTYVLSTGDPIGGAAIKVKLAGLFGLKDLYALVAIPATRGMKKADQRQLREMLGPIAKTWLSHKAAMVQALFEKEITGGMLAALEHALDEAGRLIAELEQSLETAVAGRVG